MASGKGFLTTSLVAGQTAITRMQANSPLKLLCPRRTPDAAWAYVTTFGGGLLAGDQVDLELDIAERTTCVLTSQASTKVYKSPSGKTSQQTVRGTIGKDGLLVIAPDPITCFAGANYQQSQTLDLAEGASLVFIDWLTSGRRARNEVWQFSRYASRTDIRFNQKRVFLDSILLDPKHGPLDSPFRLGRFHCMALLVIIGKRFEEFTNLLLDEISREPVRPGESLIQTASAIPHGMVLRIIGVETEVVGQVLRHKVDFLSSHIGGNPWSRKW